MKYLFTFSFNLTSKSDEDYTAVHGFSVESTSETGPTPFEFSLEEGDRFRSEMEDKYGVVHDSEGTDFETLQVIGFNTYEAESVQIKNIMNDWRRCFVDNGFKCSRVHFLGILSETGKQNFTEEDYLQFHEKWSTES